MQRKFQAMSDFLKRNKPKVRLYDLEPILNHANTPNGVKFLVARNREFVPNRKRRVLRYEAKDSLSGFLSRPTWLYGNRLSVSWMQIYMGLHIYVKTNVVFD